MSAKNLAIPVCYETVLILYNILFLLTKISCSFARCTLCRTVVFCATSAILGLLFRNAYHLVACLSNTLREVMAFRIILYHATFVLHFLFSGRPRARCGQMWPDMARCGQMWPGVARCGRVRAGASGCGRVRADAAGFFSGGCSRNDKHCFYMPQCRTSAMRFKRWHTGGIIEPGEPDSGKAWRARGGDKA